MGGVVEPGPATKLEITTSSSDSVNASSQPDISAGMIMGSVMTKKTFRRLAPRSIAASSSDLSRSASREDTTTVTKAMVKVTCAIQIEVMPFGDRPSGLNSVTNISNKDRPVTTSGITSGAVINAPNRVLPRKGLKRVITMAAKVPSITAAVAEKKAIFRLIQAALSIESSLNNSTYHLKVKPDHVVARRDSLKEKTTRMRIGRDRNASPSASIVLPPQPTLKLLLMPDVLPARAAGNDGTR